MRALVRANTDANSCSRAFHADDLEGHEEGRDGPGERTHGKADHRCELRPAGQLHRVLRRERPEATVRSVFLRFF